MAKNTLLVDGDIVAFQAAVSLEHPTKYDEDTWILWASESDTKAKFDDMMQTLTEKSGAADVIVAFTDKVNFRKELCDTYKANRAKTRKPMLLSLLKDYCTTRYRSLVYPRLEADDVLGICGTYEPLFKEPIIWSIDKDLMQIPGLHLVDDEIVEVTPEQADYFFLKQVLTGDQADNYAGCKGIGEKRATAILDEDPTWGAVVKTYEKAGLTEEDAISQARLARILRHGEYNMENSKVKLWSPN
jgi:DNA polymerase-1